MNYQHQLLTKLCRMITVITPQGPLGLRYQQQGFVQIDKVPAKPWISIILRECYQERIVNYPIKEERALHKIIALEHPQALYHIRPWQQEQRQVQFWQLQQTTNAPIIIPESLLWTVQHSGKIIERQGQTTAWFYQQPKGPVCSAKQQGLIQTRERFCHSFGIAEQTEVQSILPAEQLNQLLAGVIPTLLHYRQSLWRGFSRSNQNWRQQLLPIGLSAGVILSAYLGITSLYLQQQQQANQAILVANQEQTQRLFALKATYDQQQQQYTQYQNILNIPNLSTHLWSVIAPLMNQGLTVKRLSYLSDGRIIIKGNADSGIQILEKIKQLHYVDGAKFQAPTQRRDERDEFSIVFKIKDNNDQQT